LISEVYIKMNLKGPIYRKILGYYAANSIHLYYGWLVENGEQPSL